MKKWKNAHILWLCMWMRSRGGIKKKKREANRKRVYVVFVHITSSHWKKRVSRVPVVIRGYVCYALFLHTPSFQNKNKILFAEKGQIEKENYAVNAGRLDTFVHASVCMYALHSFANDTTIFSHWRLRTKIRIIHIKRSSHNQLTLFEKWIWDHSAKKALNCVPCTIVECRKLRISL